MQKYRSWAVCCVLLTLLLFMSGCRRRVVAGPQENLSERYHENVSVTVHQQEQKTEIETKQKAPEETSEKKKTEPGKRQEKQVKNESAETTGSSVDSSKTKKEEYDAKKKMTENKEQSNRESHSQKTDEQKDQNQMTSQQDFSKNDPDDSQKDTQENSEPDEAPRQTPSSEQSSDGMEKEFGIIMDHYRHDFVSRMTIYPCQYLTVYYETKEDYRTVNASFEEHRLIYDAAAENIASDLGKEFLSVDTGWLQKKEPEYIIKCVDASVLGREVPDTQAAAELLSRIQAREGWDQIQAVKEGHILLVSEELLQSEAGKMMFKYYVAGALHPELFTQIKWEETQKELLGESGVYAYP